MPSYWVKLALCGSTCRLHMHVEQLWLWSQVRLMLVLTINLPHSHPLSLFRYQMKGLATLLRYSCNTKHLILAYEHLEFGPLRNLIAVNVRTTAKLLMIHIPHHATSSSTTQPHRNQCKKQQLNRV